MAALTIYGSPVSLPSLQSSGVNLSATILPIVAGAITYTKKSFIGVDTTGGAAQSDLHTILGGAEGDTVFISNVTLGRSIRILHNAGNILVPDGNNMLIRSPSDVYQIIFSQGMWRVVSNSSLSTLSWRFFDYFQAVTPNTTHWLMRLPRPMTFLNWRASIYSFGSTSFTLDSLQCRISGFSSGQQGMITIAPSQTIGTVNPATVTLPRYEAAGSIFTVYIMNANFNGFVSGLDIFAEVLLH